ncbi:MAG: outer membrane protein assembly factor BamD [Myxococcota bacterium]|nr:outer membrane protein assembly factor BamD [Myxococcota bacterium]
MTNRIPMALVVFSAILLAAPVLPSAAAQDATSPAPVRRGAKPESPETLYAEGLRQMKLGSWDEAVLSFDRVRNHFPFNQYSVLAELRVADCLYEKASYLEAVDAYRQFERLHPRHSEVDYVVYRTARSEFKLSPSVPQRDQTHSRRGLQRLEGYAQRFPDSEYLPEVERLRSKALLRLSRAAVQVGHFYWKQKAWSAAERRYRLAIEAYPESPVIPRAHYRRGLSLWKLGEESGDAEEAAAYRAEALEVLRAVVDDFPDSRVAPKVERFLEEHSEASSSDTAAPTEPAPSSEQGG